MIENYYKILGVDADATQDQIKSAYRRKAKELHPDHFEGGSRPFRAVQEAYEVLCDPVRRQTHDSELARARRGQWAASGTTPQPLRRQRPPAEPLVPNRRSVRPQEAFFDIPSVFPLQEPRSHMWGAERTEKIHVQVNLTQEQARRGGTVRLWIPLAQGCPVCHGRGSDWFSVCRHCLGEGAVVDETPLEVSLPARIVDGSTGRLSLRRPGMPDVNLTLHFSVSGW